jgi:hypothetical protein
VITGRLERIYEKVYEAAPSGMDAALPGWKFYGDEDLCLNLRQMAWAPTSKQADVVRMRYDEKYWLLFSYLEEDTGDPDGQGERLLEVDRRGWRKPASWPRNRVRLTFRMEKLEIYDIEDRHDLLFIPFQIVRPGFGRNDRLSIGLVSRGRLDWDLSVQRPTIGRGARGFRVRPESSLLSME